MDLTHIHLLLNHFPTIGTIIGGGLFVMSLLMKSDDLKRASLVILLGIALLAIPTYMSGNGAQDAIKSLPGVSKALIEAHEGAALVGMAFMLATGAFAWLGLWQFRRLARVPNWNLTVILILTLVSFGLMARASNMGGEIRHEEIRSSQKAPASAAEATDEPQGLARSVGAFVTDTPWMWPTCETLHFVGLSLLLGVVLLVDLRVLGVVRGVSFQSLHRLLPWAAIGFGVNIGTGMLFFVGIPGQYIHNTAFYWKIGLAMLAALNAVYFTILDEPWSLGPKEDAPLTAKIAAASAMALWLGVLYFGSMLPFIGNSF
ncbi:MAG TPA: hypothetical protein VMH80_15630 [Bryobacteraceae bacterium]|nr:hypothetical protein [Bryobacteraceae bacterium]